MLCAACEHFRFPYIAENHKKYAMANKKSSSSTPTTNPPPEATGTTNTNAVQSIIINEMLAYAAFYRNKSNVDALKRVMLSSFPPSDISEAKKSLVTRFQQKIGTSPFLAERRNSTVRPAHEAEIDDVIGILDLVDTQGAVNDVLFVAADLDALPRFGPEEINIAAVVDRQSRVESAIGEMSASIKSLQTSHVDSAAAAAVSSADTDSVRAMLNDVQLKLDSFVSSVSARLDKISTLQSVVATRATTATNSPQSPDTEAIQRDIQRRNNVIVFGIPEHQDSTVWRRKIDDAFEFVTGHSVDILDVFRLGKYSSDKIRPILVKLRVAWDRRLILSRSNRLRNFCIPKVFVVPDESLESRRKNTFERLKNKAERANKAVRVVDNDTLFVDDEAIFSLKNGFINHNDNDQ